MRKEVFQFKASIPDEPIKIQDGCQKFKMASKGLKYSNIFTKNTLKFEFKIVIFTDCFICTCL